MTDQQLLNKHRATLFLAHCARADGRLSDAARLADELRKLNSEMRARMMARGL